MIAVRLTTSTEGTDLWFQFLCWGKEIRLSSKGFGKILQDGASKLYFERSFGIVLFPDSVGLYYGVQDSEPWLESKRRYFHFVTCEMVRKRLLDVYEGVGIDNEGDEISFIARIYDCTWVYKLFRVIPIRKIREKVADIDFEPCAVNPDGREICSAWLPLRKGRDWKDFVDELRYIKTVRRVGCSKALSCKTSKDIKDQSLTFTQA